MCAVQENCQKKCTFIIINHCCAKHKITTVYCYQNNPLWHAQWPVGRITFKKSQNAQKSHQGYDHVVLLLALIKLDYNLTSTSWHSSSSLRCRRRTYRTILEWADHALFKMVRYVLLRPLRPELNGQDVEVRL
jgi:hypothetical protein